MLSLAAATPWTLTSPPPAWTVWLAGILVLPGLVFPASRLPSCFALVVYLSMTDIQGRLADRLVGKASGTDATVTGVVANLPARKADSVEFLFRTDSRSAQEQTSPRLIRVRWYDPVSVVRGGERWQFDLRLQAPRGRVNFTGPDDERSYFANHIGALATVTGAGGRLLLPAPGLSLPGWRENLRERLTQVLGDEPSMAQILALSLADRSRMTPVLWNTFTQTGTGHLLAISGLHIGFAAVIGYRIGWMLAILTGKRRRMRSRLMLPWSAAVLVAIVYAALAGFGVSTRRALIMLLALAATSMSRRNPGPLLGWSLALLIVLLLEPAAPLTPGFWLSFCAVFVLIAFFGPRIGSIGKAPRAGLSQLAVTLAMLPLGMFWFQRSTALGLLANLFAIPVVSLAVIPLLLPSLILLGLDGEDFARYLLLPAAWIVEGLTMTLSRIAALGSALVVRTPQPAFVMAMISMFGVLMFLGPRGFRARFLALMLALAALTASPRVPGPGALRLELLDVGQGTAALLASADALTVIDSGPGKPGVWDHVDSTLLPAIRATGHAAPARILISHGDLDHAGGFAALRERFPQALIRRNAEGSTRSARTCHSGVHWTDPAARYRVLHPSPFLPYLGNRSSCVLSVRTAHNSLLLPGDIDGSVERRLVLEGLQPHEILVAPHHGSRTSSSVHFLATLRPDWVLIPAGAGNRFGFPHREVLDRYRKQGIRAASVADCGALRLEIPQSGAVRLRSARKARHAIWRWPAAETCP